MRAVPASTPAKRKPSVQNAGALYLALNAGYTKRSFRMMAQFLSSTTELIFGFFWWTVPFLLVLGAVVVVHEFGHFLAGRALGVKVETFSIGFGPEIASFHDKRGTRWRLAWIPLGGYVRFKGDENAASMPSSEELEKLTPGEREGNLHAASLWRRVV